MLTECPHCFTDVLVKRDGTCPACLRDVGDLTGVKTDVAKVTIRNRGKALPGVCVVCGEAASEILNFCRKVKNPHYHSRVSMGGLIGVLITWLFDWAAGNTHRELTAQLARCRSCGTRKAEPVEKHLDFEDQAITLLVHAKFRRAIEGSEAVLKRGAGGASA
jgi:hypothetical protein